MSTCRSSKTTEGLKWSCTRQHGHKGDHQARGINGVILRKWRSVKR